MHLLRMKENSLEMYEAVCYKNSYLDQVIIRTDFMEYIPTEKIHNDEIEKVIQGFFPRKGKSQAIKHNAINFTVDMNNPQKANAQSNVLEGLQKEFFSNNQKNKVIISNLFLIFEIHEYISFEDINKSIKAIVQAVFSECKPTVVRTGIRYINLYNSGEIKLKKKFFSPEIAACLLTKFDKNTSPIMTRSMHLAEYRINNMLLNFRYGMFNPNYPGPIRDNSFSLDYDCFSNDAFSSSDDVLEVISNSHNAIQELFEASITDQLRKEMNGE